MSGITGNKRKSRSTTSAPREVDSAPATEPTAVNATSSSSASTTAASKKRKTSKTTSTVAQDTEEEEKKEDAVDEAEMLVELESSILGGDSASIVQHYNSLVKILSLTDPLRVATTSSTSSLSSLPVDEIATRVSAVQSAVRVFTQWLASGEFLTSKTALNKKAKANTKKGVAGAAALQAVQGLVATQYKKLNTLLLSLLQCDVDAVQSNALHACMDLVQAEGCSIAAASKNPAGTVQETLANGGFQPLLRTIMLSAKVSSATRTEFATTFIDVHSDLRHSVYTQLKSLAQLSPPEFTSLSKEYASTPSSLAGPSHIIEYLVQANWKAEVEKQWIVLPSGADGDGDEDMDLLALPTMQISSAALQKLYSETWLGILKHKLSVEEYKLILIQLHTLIIPAMTQPLLLADFLTDSYNIGGIISLLSLNGLFILISKFNLDYPDFFKKLYKCCQPYVFHAKYRARFFQLVSLFLTSSYLPSYLVCAFVKRFARLSLTAPPSGSIFCIAVIYNLLRRHPVCRPLINRTLLTQTDAIHATKLKKGEMKTVTEIIPDSTKVSEKEKEKVNGGILSSLSSLLKARQTAIATGTLSDPLNSEEENTSLRLTLPVYHSPAPLQSTTAGLDPYKYEEDDPSLANAGESSLWEIKTLCDHFSPTVSNLAKVFFTTHAPKKDLEMEKYIEQSYETLFAKESERRVNQKVALQQHQKFTGLFDDAAQSIGLTFKLQVKPMEPAPTMED